MKILQNNFDYWCKRKTDQFYRETKNSERQMHGKHGHVISSVVCHKRNYLSL